MPPSQWPRATAAKPATSETADVEPGDAGQAGRVEAVRVEDPGREGGEGADAAAGDDHQRLAVQRRPGDEPEGEGAAEVDDEDPEREGASRRAEISASTRKRAAAATPPSSPTAIQPGAVIGAARGDSERAPPRLQRDPEPDAEVAGGDRDRRVGRRQRQVAPVDHLVQLQLHGREGGQGAADAGAEEGVTQALRRVVAEEREEVAEQQRPDHVHHEGRPRPLPGTGRRRLASPTRTSAPTTPPA